MISVYVSITETTKVGRSPNPFLKNYLFIGNELTLMLPEDIQKQKEALLWLATQLEQEAQKL